MYTCTHIFDEKVKSKSTMLLSVFTLIIGLIGMGYSSSQTHIVSSPTDNIELIGNINENDLMEPVMSNEVEQRSDKHSTIPFADTNSEKDSSNSTPHTDSIPTIDICGFAVSRRKVGIVAAIMNGSFSGTSFVPMQYLRYETNMIYFYSILLHYFLFLASKSGPNKTKIMI